MGSGWTDGSGWSLVRPRSALPRSERRLVGVRMPIPEERASRFLESSFRALSCPRSRPSPLPLSSLRRRDARAEEEFSFRPCRRESGPTTWSGRVRRRRSRESSSDDSESPRTEPLRESEASGVRSPRARRGPRLRRLPDPPLLRDSPILDRAGSDVSGVRPATLRSLFCEFGSAIVASSLFLPRPIRFLSRPRVPSVLVPFWKVGIIVVVFFVFVPLSVRLRHTVTTACAPTHRSSLKIRTAANR